MKGLQKLDSSEKSAVNKMAFARFEKEHLARGHVEAPPTERYGWSDSSVNMVLDNTFLSLMVGIDAPKLWTADEQKVSDEHIL